MQIRVGHGYDVHKWGADKPLILAGVNIPHHSGLIAHSDGDVVLHAITDALLGAMALGDIGQHFPDTDNRYKGADSMLLLQEALRLASEKKFAVANLDVTVVAQAPKLASYIQPMRESIAKGLNTTIDAVNVKATTTEKLGFVGREEGIACHCVMLMTAQGETTK
ncbi:MAG: 2-C-methyl-D-erythritol 2,4-cyclodiphosphate synthase [Pseudomonadota bacterium]